MQEGYNDSVSYGPARAIQWRLKTRMYVSLCKRQCRIAHVRAGKWLLITVPQGRTPQSGDKKPKVAMQHARQSEPSLTRGQSLGDAAFGVKVARQRRSFI